MAEALPHKVLSELIGSIYDCTLDPARWEQTLGDIVDALDCATAVLGLVDARNDRLLINRTVGLDEQGLEALARHGSEVNAILIDHVASISSLDEPFLVSRNLSRDYIEASPYIRELLNHGLVDVIQYHLVHMPMRIGGVGFARHQRQGTITDREIEIGGLLLPHLRRAVTISNVLDARTIEGARMAEALDALRCGVVLTNDHAAIVYANRAAEHMLRVGSAIRNARGLLEAKAPAAIKELRMAIKIAAREEVEIGRTGLAVCLTEPGAPPVFAHVLPLTGSELRTQLQPDAVAAVFVGASPDEQDAADVVARAFGLTPAEARVLASLLAGRTLTETAAGLGIAGTTARTHLDSIFLKTGISRQAELVRLAMRIAPPAVV